MPDWQDLAENFYAGALDDERWLDALRQAASRFDAVWGVYTRMPYDARHRIEFLGVGFDPRWVDRWDEVISRPDPMSRWQFEPRVGVAVNFDRHVPPDGSVLYEEWIRPQGMRYSIGVFTALDASDASLVQFNRPLDHRPFDEADEQAMGRLGRHLVQAAALRRHVRALEGRLAVLHAMLDGIAAPAFAVDAKGRIVERNAAAQALLARRRGLHERLGVLACDRPPESARLGRLIATAAARAGAGTLAIRRKDGRPLSCFVAPLALPVPLPAAATPLALLLVTDPDEVRPASAEHLRELYGLTPAEAKVALAVPEADRLQDVADRLGVGLATVRTHLARILEKTGTSRQAELVRLLLAHGKQGDAGS